MKCKVALKSVNDVKAFVNITFRAERMWISITENIILMGNLLWVFLVWSWTNRLKWNWMTTMQKNYLESLRGLL